MTESGLKAELSNSPRVRLSVFRYWRESLSLLDWRSTVSLANLSEFRATISYSKTESFLLSPIRESSRVEKVKVLILGSSPVRSSSIVMYARLSNKMKIIGTTTSFSSTVYVH